MNKVDVEIFPCRLGDNNVIEMIENKEFKVLLTIRNEDNQFRAEYILDKEQCVCLIGRLKSILNDKKVQDLGFNFA